MTFTNAQRYFYLPIISATLASFSWIPGWFPGFIWIAFIPLWVAWIELESSPKLIFLQSWAFSFVFTLIVYPWVGPAAGRYWALSELSSTLLELVFASFAHIYFPIAALAWSAIRIFFRRRYASRSLDRAVDLVFLAVLTHVLETFWPQVFKLNLGHPMMWSSSPLRQLAEYIGFSGLSGMILIANALLANVLIDVRRGKLRPAFAVGMILFLAFLCAWTLGSKAMNEWRAVDREFRFVFVQPSLSLSAPAATRFSSEIQSSYFDKLFGLTSSALAARSEYKNDDRSIDLAIWPENSVFADEPLEQSISHRFRSPITNKFGHFLIGVTSRDENKALRSLALLIEPDGMIRERYQKHRLMPFAEHLPGSRYLPFLSRLSANRASLVPGRSAELRSFNVAGVRIGPSICYDALIPEVFQTLSAAGSEIFINLTNDEWFGRTTEIHQHAYVAFSRSIEFRRPMIRVGKVGLSGTVLATGEVRPLAEPWTKTSGLGAIGYRSNPRQTFYAAHRETLQWISPLIALLLSILLALRREGLPNLKG